MNFTIMNGILIFFGNNLHFTLIHELIQLIGSGFYLFSLGFPVTHLFGILLKGDVELARKDRRFLLQNFEWLL